MSQFNQDFDFCQLSYNNQSVVDISPIKTSMVIEQWPIDRPTPYAKNARKLSPHAVDKVAASLQEFGWQQPLVVDSVGVLIVGHTRLLAAKKLGYTEVPVLVAHWLTAAQVKAYRLMDNRSHDETSWDFDLLGPEFAELKALDFNIDFTGFNSREVEKLLLQANPAEDEVPDLPLVPVTQLGDIWRMGKHRLWCGDSTNAHGVSRLLAGSTPFLMVTDPPYGVEYDPEWRQESGLQDNTRQFGKVANDDRADWTEAYRLFPGSVIYVWHANLRAIEVGSSIQNCGFEIRSIIIWAKQALQISRGHYHWQHEPCWYAVRKGKTAQWHGDRKQSTLWQVSNLNGNGNRGEAATGHGTQKPVELMRRPILNHTQAGESVYDPFLGSGTTLIACELTERVCFGIDIDPAYCDVIVERWQNLTGKEATLEGYTTTFAEAKRGRQARAEDAIKEEIFSVPQRG